MAKLQQGLSAAAQRDARLRQMAETIAQTMVRAAPALSGLAWAGGPIGPATGQWRRRTHDAHVPSFFIWPFPAQAQQYIRLDVACGVLEATSPVLSEAEEKYFAKLKDLSSCLGQLQSDLSLVRLAEARDSEGAPGGRLAAEPVSVPVVTGAPARAVFFSCSARRAWWPTLPKKRQQRQARGQR